MSGQAAALRKRLPASAIGRFAARPAARASGLLAAAWVVSLTLNPWADESVGDLGVRRAFARLLLDGLLPYRDFPFEYPPLAAPVVAIPGLVGTSPEAYWSGFALMTFALALCVLLLTGRLAALTGGDERRAMLAVALAPLLLGAVIRTHFDLAPVALTLGALLAIVSRRTVLGFALLGLGAMAKGFPLIVAPVALAWLVARAERLAALRGAAALVATLLIVGGSAFALSPGGAADTVGYQGERPVQVESAPASVLLAVDALGGTPAAAVSSHRSVGVRHPLEDAAVLTSAALLGASLALFALLAATAARGGGGREDEGMEGRGEGRTGGREGGVRGDQGRALVLASLGAVAAFATFGKVLSPQFLIWVVPLVALAFAWRMWALAAAGAVACALTLAEFPSRYFDLVARDPAAVAVTAARNFALVATVALTARALIGPLGRAGAGPARSTAPARLAPPR